MKKNVKKELLFTLAISLVITGVFLVVQPSFANWAARVLTGLVSAVISGLGVVVGLVIEVLIRVAQYNEFTGARAIEKGWIVVRDLANMFFILVFLIIAFATILRIESYNYKKHLPKLMLMAVFINFSKTIAGLIIDFGQVAMLTFVNGFKDIGAGNLIHMLGLTEILQLQENADISDWSILAAYILAFLYMIVALVTIIAILAVLVMRIVMIWIYVVLSPLAFLLAAFPGGKKYSSMWWSNFSKEVIVGPVLAFFIWLSFATVSITSGGGDIIKMDDITDDMTREQIEQIEASNNQVSKAATSDVFIKFIISIGMLVGGLVVSKQIGATAGSATGSALNSLNSGKKKVLGAGRFALRRTGSQLKTWGGDLVDQASDKAGMDFNLARGYKRYKTELKDRRQKKQFGIYSKTLETASKGGAKGNLAMMLTGNKAWDHFKERRLFKGMKSQGELYRGSEELKKKNKEIAHTREERGKYLSAEEKKKIQDEQSKITTRNKDIDQEIVKKEKELNSGDKSDSEKKKIEGELESLREEKSANDSQKNVLQGKLDNSIDSDPKAKEIDAKLQKLEQEKQKIDDNLKKIRTEHGSGFDLTNARIAASAGLEGEAAQKISNVQNDGDLVNIIKEAIDRKDHAMIQTAYKKLAKTGNFNELNKAFNLGTDHKGMLKLAKDKFQGEAGMTEQDSLGLLGEVGDIAKSINHFSGFGHVTMENGRWRETSSEEQETAVHIEQSKVQVQEAVRKIAHLGAGAYKTGEDGNSPHTMDNYSLSKAIIATFASKDPQYAKQLADTGNTNLINTLSANNNIEILRQNGAVEVAKVLEDIKESRKGVAKDNNVSDMIQAINLGDSSNNNKTNNQNTQNKQTNKGDQGDQGNKS